MTVKDSALDSCHLYSSVTAFPEQCKQVIWEMAQVELPQDFYDVRNIVVSGMGGSALGGRVIASLERQTLRVPVIISTEYHLPNFVDKHSLVIISSYSGNTEETISSLSESLSRRAKIFIVCSGGKLAQIAAEQKIPHYVFDPRSNPSGQPRMGLGYAVLTLIMLLTRCNLVHPFKDLGKLPDFLHKLQDTRTEYDNLAEKLMGKIPILVASEHLKGAAHCVRNQLNENSKNFAALFDLPELNHHLMEGLTFPKSNSDNLQFVLFKSSHYHPEVLKRYPLTELVLKKLHVPSTTVNLAAPSRLFEVMELIQLGGFLSFYLSQKNGVDPGPIPWVDYFKDELKNLSSK